MIARIQLAAIAAALALAPTTAGAWHDKGHMMVAAIAWEQMDPAVRARAVQLLKINKDYETLWTKDIPDGLKEKAAFMFASLWPDDIKRRQSQGYWSDGDQPPKTKKAGQNIGYADKRMHKYWHYKDIPFSTDGTKTFPAPAPNAETQIKRFTAAIASKFVKDHVKSYDVVWLIHMVGDVHQPLHATSRFTKDHKTKEGDAGGNGVSTVCCGTLHSLWDGAVGEVDRSKPAQAVNDAIAAATALATPSATEVAVSDPQAWILESFSIAKASVYKNPPIKSGKGPFAVGADYADTAKKISGERIALAGARLAALFNASLK